MPARKKSDQKLSGSSALQSLQALLSIRADTDLKGTTANIIRDSELHGLNLYTLVFAIFIASIGLNTNSAAVIIGAMLISPLMGPIMGIGFAMGTYDFMLLKKSGKSLALMTVVSLATSTLYFLLSPLAVTNQELLARTYPTIYDVLIAIFGGAAGIVAGSRKDKSSNVIPGVAIATALMPPLCTAGFALANGKPGYFLGAIYLYLINSVFIGISTLFFVRYFGFPPVTRLAQVKARNLQRNIMIFTAMFVLPSVYFAYDVVQESSYRSRVEKFVTENFNLEESKVIRFDIVRKSNRRKIEVALAGEPVPDDVAAHIRASMPRYQIGDADLVLIQADGSPDIDYAEVLTDLQAELRELRQPELLMPSVSEETKVLLPWIKSLEFGGADKESGTIRILMKLQKEVSAAEKEKLQKFLQLRLNNPAVRLLEVR